MSTKVRKDNKFESLTTATTLERMNKSSISLATLASRINDVHCDPKLPKYNEIVEAKLQHLTRIAGQLNEDIGQYPNIVFGPGKLVDELNVLIAKKEEALAASKSLQQHSANISLCYDFLHGRCSRGVTCDESHTLEDLENHVMTIVKTMADEQGGTVFTVTTTFGPEAWSSITRALQNREFKSMVIRECDKHALRSISQFIKSHTIPSVRAVDLSHNNIGLTNPKGILKIASALQSNVTLAQLSLGYNHLGAPGALAIAQSLKPRALSDGSLMGGTLVAVNFAGNGIAHNDGAYSYFCDAVAAISGLKKLSLAHNNLGQEGVKKLLTALGTGTAKIEFLDLYATQAGDQGGVALAQYIATDKGSALRFLNLGWNKLTFEGIVPICVALEDHARLEILRIPYNLGFGRKGAIALAEYIKKSQVITLIDLRWTSLGDDGAATVSEAIAHNKSVKSVLLFGNELDARTELLVAEKMKRQGGHPHANLEKGLTPLQCHDEVW